MLGIAAEDPSKDRATTAQDVDYYDLQIKNLLSNALEEFKHVDRDGIRRGRILAAAFEGINDPYFLQRSVSGFISSLYYSDEDLMASVTLGIRAAIYRNIWENDPELFGRFLHYCYVGLSAKDKGQACCGAIRTAIAGPYSRCIGSDELDTERIGLVLATVANASYTPLSVQRLKFLASAVTFTSDSMRVREIVLAATNGANSTFVQNLLKEVFKD